VPYGHYIYKYTFSEAGIYALDIDINDTNYSGQGLVFTFPINVSTSFAGYLMSSMLPLVSGIVIISAVATGIGVVIFLNRRKRKGRKTIKSTKA
jgi:hypothetical protein